MKEKNTPYGKILYAVHHYLIFFLITAFITSCCTALFTKLLSNTLGLELTGDNLNVAAKATFLNVLLLSVLFTAFDALRRKITVRAPAKKITDAAEKIMQGDFSVRIPESHGSGFNSEFTEIIRCFNKMAEELAGIETLGTDFIANVSHELKTPLAVMQSYATMLQNPSISAEERAEYAKEITEASKKLSKLITNILRLNKLENRQLPPASQVYELGEQLCEALLDFEELWEQKSIEIDADIANGIFVRTDPEMMRLVWSNLFSNAIKFTDNGGKVTVTLSADGEYADVCIADTGCGISAEVGSHIFDKFYQADTSHATQGNGLGLALVKRVIDLTQCEISVESEIGHGTAFTVRIRRYGDAEA